jgi:D-glycero-beta-D-manno-heptose-7-phosphate kinase
MDATAILKRLENLRAMVVGDVMLDRYLTGSVSRISPEAPVPVVLHRSTEDRLGGAANVALNIAALGAAPVLCSVVGDDTDAGILEGLLPAQGISSDGILRSSKRKTTVKTRVLGNNQQMLRIDQEDTHSLTPDEETAFLERCSVLLRQGNIGVLILQDYNKGVLSLRVIESMIALAQKFDIPVAVDPKKENFFAYRNVQLFKPNLKEIRDSVPFAVHADMESLKNAAEYLRKRLQNTWTMITLSEKGLYLDDEKTAQLYPTIARNVADVSGAGDTVISIAALGLAARLPMALIAALSNLAGGQVCEYPGVVPVQRAVLEQELSEYLKVHGT